MSASIIGIDLGTTNCTMACLSDGHVIEQVALPQILQAGTQGKHFSLPSFLYYPLAEELQVGCVKLDWKDHSPCIGTFARDRGGELPTRTISSAKSWLCHYGIDRHEKILPFDSEDITQQKLSPVEACAALLQHMHEAWNYLKPDTPFKDQQVFITVPASFDPSARQLIQEAAQLADYPAIILLEEPQAAFYAWLHAHQDDWREQLKVGDRVLVIDIGGGTTDFSLIAVEEENGNLTLKRLAVGEHLLLGGDNIDLALAYFAKQKLEEQGHFIDHWQLQGLVHQCRKAKEVLLGAHPPVSIDITLLGRGSRLIGNTLKTSISLMEAEELVLNGFIPIVPLNEKVRSERRSGIQQVGLPYVHDPRISCQLANFLMNAGGALPTAILFNGGTLKASALRQRLITLLHTWTQAEIKELKGADYDYAVSRGAVYYGLARSGQALRIRAGTNHSYFIGVEEAAPAVPGIEPPLQAVCIVPFGMEEGEERTLTQQTFSLVVGEHAIFRFFSCPSQKLSNGIEPTTGTVVRQWKQELTELSPIEAVLDQSGFEGKTIQVYLKSKVTELGFLELWCEAPEGRQWKLEFAIRNSG